MRRALILAAALALTLSTPALGGGDHPVCPAGGDHCKPPQPAFEPAGSFGPLCGDPWTFARLNNRQSEVEAVYRFAFINRSGKARGVTRTLAAGERTRTPWKRVRPGTVARIVAWLPDEKATTKTLVASLPVRFRDAIHWGIKPCPGK